jgi:hypothetical protein
MTSLLGLNGETLIGILNSDGRIDYQFALYRPDIPGRLASVALT